MFIRENWSENGREWGHLSSDGVKGQRSFPFLPFFPSRVFFLSYLAPSVLIPGAKVDLQYRSTIN